MVPRGSVVCGAVDTAGSWFTREVRLLLLLLLADKLCVDVGCGYGGYKKCRFGIADDGMLLWYPLSPVAAL